MQGERSVLKKAGDLAQRENLVKAQSTGVSSVDELAAKVGVTRTTLYNWAKQSPLITKILKFDPQKWSILFEDGPVLSKTIDGFDTPEEAWEQAIACQKKKVELAKAQLAQMVEMYNA